MRTLVARFGHDLTVLLMPVLRLSYSALYSTHMGSNRGGLLSCAADFFELFENGIRGGERRFFTYVLCEDSLRLVPVTLSRSNVGKLCQGLKCNVVSWRPRQVTPQVQMQISFPPRYTISLVLMTPKGPWQEGYRPVNVHHCVHVCSGCVTVTLAVCSASV